MLTRRTANPRNPRSARTVLTGDVERFDAAQRMWGETSTHPHPLHDAVREAVATALTPKQREVVEACFFEGLSQSEIARRLGVTQQVVQKRLYGAGRNGRLVGGALSRLREALSPFVTRGVTS